MSGIPIEVTIIEQALANMRPASGPAPIAAAGTESFAATLTQATSDLSAGDGSSGAGAGLFVGLLDVGVGSEGLTSNPVAFSWPWSTSISGSVGPTTGARTALIAPKPLSPPSPGGLSGRDVVDMAARFQGTPYVWGGTSPQGFDCSGFVQYVFGRLGVSLPRTSEQQALAGSAVPSLADAQPGDLLFFAGSDGTPSAPGHVAIYLGNAQMIDAPYTGTTVQVQSVSSAGPVVAIRRVIGQGA